MSIGHQQIRYRIRTGERRRPASIRYMWRCAALIALLLMPRVVQAAEFSYAAGDVACLITAINTANANGQENLITLAGGTYTLTVADNDTNGPNGLPSVTGMLTIRGMGAATSIIDRASDAPLFRIMHVSGSATLTLEELTLRGGLQEVEFDAEVRGGAASSTAAW